MAKGSSPARDQASLGLEAEKPKVPEWDPRCYDGGKGPNPYLAEWIREHGTALGGAESRGLEPLSVPLEGSKRTRVYKMHSYHQGKKPHEPICEYIRALSCPGEVVLDPFCGSGSALLAAVMEGRRAVGIDLSPAATFIALNYATPASADELRAAVRCLEPALETIESEHYLTACPVCGGPGLVDHTVYSTMLRCPRCGQDTSLIGANEAAEDLGIRACCPHCLKRGIQEPLSSRMPTHGFNAVRARIDCTNDECRERSTVSAADAGLPPVPGPVDWYPTQAIPDGLTTRQALSNGFQTVDELFGARNLSALASLRAAIGRVAVSERTRRALLFAFTGIVISMSRLQGYHRDEGFPNQIQRGTLYTPPVHREYNVVKWYRGKLGGIIGGYGALAAVPRASGDVILSTQSAERLALPDNSVDYVFTDPPYGGLVQYGEANLLWESWLGYSPDWWGEEVTLNAPRGLGEDQWVNRMKACMRECLRVLKPDRWVTLCFHGGPVEWELLQEVMEQSGFVVDDLLQAGSIESSDKSQKQISSEHSLKRDLVINFRKPYPGERPVRVRVAFGASDSGELFEQKVITVIHAFLSRYPGATRDHIWDAVVSRLVRQGDMERHDFDSILRQVAEANEAGEWYLLEEDVEDLADSEAARADAAAEALEARIADHEAESTPGAMEYSDILEWYLVEFRGDRPRRQLLEWLPEYFFQAPGGGYRNPASDEEREQKRMGRESGLNRRVRRYLRDPASVAPAPDQPTLCDWLRHCYRAGLYEEGCKLVDEGHIRLTDLSEELRLDAEEEAAMCRSRLRQRASAPVEKPKSKPKSGKRSVNQRQLDL